MQSSHRFILIVFILSLFFFTSCSSTRVTGVWKKSDYSGLPFTSILVVGLTGDQANKFLWENTMATRLQKAGVAKVVTTLRAFPDVAELSEKDIIDYAVNNNIDGVLVTRLVDTRQEEVYYPPTGGFYSGVYGYYGSFSSYYAHAYNRVYTPGRTVKQTTVLLETNLYQVNTQDLIWSMSSDTTKADNVQTVRRMSDSVSKKVLATLKNNQLI